MKIFTFIFLTIITVFFSACSSKEVFEPEKVKDSWDYYGDIDEKIIDISSTAALLENRKVLIVDYKTGEKYDKSQLEEYRNILLNFDYFSKFLIPLLKIEIQG